jgi:hypothetical protein
LKDLLAAVDKSLPAGDPAKLSLLSSNLIEKIAQNTLGQIDSAGLVPLNGGAHNVIDPARGIRLGLTLTNLNGVNYQYTMFGGDPFCYTDFSDQMLRVFSVSDRSLDRWNEIREAAVACGAFPIAFRTKDLPRAVADYQPSDTLVPFPADPYTFTYTDGGVLQNQPLGMAKNLVDKNDQHIDNDNRFYLFVSPSPMEGRQKLDLHEADADMIQVAKRLFDVYTGQSTFRDWIQADTINQQIEILDQRAAGLADALAHGRINPTPLTKASKQILELLYASGADGETEEEAIDRLARQYEQEVGSLGGAVGQNGKLPTKAQAFLYEILALEKAANLGERDRMQIYGIVTKDGDLAGAGIFAFLGFFDVRYRDHDYDCGRTVAQRLLANPKFGEPGQLGPIRFTPAPIRPIDPTLTGLHLDQVPKTQVKEFKDGLTARINEILKDSLSNPLERYPAQLGADLILKLLLDWEFSRNIQD